MPPRSAVAGTINKETGFTKIFYGNHDKSSAGLIAALLQPCRENNLADSVYVKICVVYSQFNCCLRNPMTLFLISSASNITPKCGASFTIISSFCTPAIFNHALSKRD